MKTERTFSYLCIIKLKIVVPIIINKTKLFIVITSKVRPESKVRKRG